MARPSDEPDPRTVIEELVISGLVDWVYESWVYSTVAELTPLVTIDDRSRFTIGTIAELIARHLMVAGELDENGAFRSWDLPTGAAIERVIERWDRDWRGQVPTPGAVVWLCNTEAGDQLARDVLDREDRGEENGFRDSPRPSDRARRQ